VYRLWRDLGYAIGALLAGLTADALGLPAAMWLVAALTFASGVVVAVRMSETLRRAAAPAPSPTCVEPTELRSVEGAVIIDVRSPDEFAAGHVAGAINIPLDSLAAQTAALPKEAVLVTVCGKGGGRSERAATELRALGWNSARSLCGGTQAWMQLTAQGT
jgi:rhodanese-related sulfurtransferase